MLPDYCTEFASGQGLPCGNEAFYSPETQYGHRVTKVYGLSWKPALPALKFIKGLGHSLHILQIAPYKEMKPITRKIRLRSNQALTCQRSPKFHTNVSNSEMLSPKIPYKVSKFSHF